MRYESVQHRGASALQPAQRIGRDSAVRTWGELGMLSGVRESALASGENYLCSALR